MATIQEKQEETVTEVNNSGQQNQNNKLQIKWLNVTLLTALHLAALYGLYLLLFEAQLKTVVFWYLLGALSGMGVTAGAHRLWSHRAYRATTACRTLLMLLNCIAGQNDLFVWCRDHRLHHRATETEADPHDARRGFFFAHMGWLMVKKHPQVIIQGRQLDMRDLEADPVVRFQRRFYLPLVAVFSVLLPSLLPVLLFDERAKTAIFACGALRYVYTLHCTWFVNSVAHLYGEKPYDRNIMARESPLVVYSTYGEGYHNYHHVFPYDYSTSELDWRHTFNFSTLLIDGFAKIGWAYDRKRAPERVITRRKARTGEVSTKCIKSNGISGHLWSVALATSHLTVPLAIRGLIILIMS